MKTKLEIPLFHGTSSHYIDSFEAGAPTATWSYRDVAMSFVTEVSEGLERHDVEIDWWQKSVLEQASHWQHGALFASPVLSTAARYAYTTAEFGGELIEIGVLMLKRLEEVSSSLAHGLRLKYRERLPMLSGGGLPIVLEITGLTMDQLSTEQDGGDAFISIIDVVKIWKEETSELFDALAQQSNFRIAPCAGLISRVFNVKLKQNSHDDFNLFQTTWDDLRKVDKNDQ